MLYLNRIFPSRLTNSFVPDSDISVTKDGIVVRSNTELLWAEVVITDCEEALKELTDDLAGSKWRRRWAAFITLLRCIGHVLEKVDAQENIHVAQFLALQWPVLREDKIFKYFIEDERNGILKEYRSSAGQSVTVMPGRAYPSNHFHTYTINDGPFKDRDPREVGREALDWWEHILERMRTETQ